MYAEIIMESRDKNIGENIRAIICKMFPPNKSPIKPDKPFKILPSRSTTWSEKSLASVKPWSTFSA